MFTNNLKQIGEREMSNDDEFRDKLAKSGRCPPNRDPDIWSAMKSLCLAYASRRQIPPEDLIQVVYVDFVTRNSDILASKEAETLFKEQFRALYKYCRLALDHHARGLVLRADDLAGLDHHSADQDVLHLVGHDQHADHLHLSLPLDGPHGSAAQSDATLRATSPQACPEEFTTEEAAEFLGYSRSYVIKLVKAGEIPARMVGRYRRILVSEVIKYRDKSFAETESLLDEVTESAMAEVEARGPTERSDDVLP